MENNEKLTNVKIVQIGGSGAVIIPKRNLRYSNLKVGDYVDLWYKKVGGEDGQQKTS